MSEDPQTVEELLNTFMTDPALKALCAMKIRMMAQETSTDRKLLANALTTICETFAGNDQKINEGVGRLFLEFKKRKG